MSLSNLEKSCSAAFALGIGITFVMALQQDPVNAEQRQCEDLVRTNNLEIGKILSAETQQVMRQRSLVNIKYKAMPDGGYTVAKCESENGKAKFTREEHAGVPPKFRDAANGQSSVSSDFPAPSPGF